MALVVLVLMVIVHVVLVWNGYFDAVCMGRRLCHFEFGLFATQAVVIIMLCYTRRESGYFFVMLLTLSVHALEGYYYYYYNYKLSLSSLLLGWTHLLGTLPIHTLHIVFLWHRFTSLLWWFLLIWLCSWIIHEYTHHHHYWQTSVILYRWWWLLLHVGTNIHSSKKRNKH